MEAKDYIFGIVILNDWSARDIQAFEMAPLGPFHSKGFGTSISAWVVTVEALAACESAVTIPQEPAPLAHLEWTGEEKKAAWDVELTVHIMRELLIFHCLISSSLPALIWLSLVYLFIPAFLPLAYLFCV
jgi:fumarylacetoacetase